MVITGVAATRHRSLRDARATVRINAVLRPVLRRYRRSEWLRLLALDSSK